MDELLEYALRNSIASAEIDGAKFTPEMIELLRKNIYGEISIEDFHKEAMEIAKRS